MPFRSRRQQRYLFAKHPAIARKWADHTTDFDSLPERVGESEDPEKKGFFSMSLIKTAAERAAADAMVAKLAADTQITPELVRHLAKTAGMAETAFVKAAYADPDDYANFLKVASGVKIGMVTKGMILEPLMAAIKSRAGKVGRGVADAGKSAVGAPGAPQGGFFGTSTPKGHGIGNIMGALPTGKSQAGRIATPAVGLGASAAGTAGLVNQATPSPKPPAGPTETAAAVGSAASSPSESPAQSNGPAANPTPEAPKPQEQSRGSSTAVKGGLLAGGAALGAGAGALARRKKKPKEVTAHDVAADVLRKVLVEKYAGLYKKAVANELSRHLDGLARKMPLEKTAQIRTLQREVAAGKPLVGAIKVAYPKLNDVGRGMLAQKIVSHFKSATDAKVGKLPFKTVGRKETTCKPNEAGKMMKSM